MSKKNSHSKKRKPQSGGGKHRLACTCHMCSLGKGLARPIFLYIMMDEAMGRAHTQSRSQPPTESFNALVARAERILRTHPGPVFSTEMTTDPDEMTSITPGYVVLCRESEFTDDDDDSMPAGLRLVPLDIWGMDFRDGGVGHMQEVMRDANEKNTGLPFTIALWVTGFFDFQAPIHVLATDASGELAGFMMLRDVCNPVSGDVMRAAMPFLVHETMGAVAAWQTLVRGYTGPDTRLRPSPDRYLAALTFALAQLEDVTTEAADLAGELDEADEIFDKGLSSEMKRFEARAESKRQELVAAHRQQMDVVRARAQSMDAEAAALRQQLAAVQRELAAARTNDPAPAPAATTSEPETDEAYSHWRDTAEHQAAVLRQTRLALTVAARNDRVIPADSAEAAVAKRAWRLDELADWEAENADRVVLLRRAFHSAKKSTYENEALIFDALDAIATTYRDVKLGLVDRMAFKQRCEESALEIGGSVTEQPSKDYFFLWGGKQRFLDQHVGRGNARAPRFCLRIYFTWDEDEGKVIVGWLPSHLPTRDT